MGACCPAVTREPGPGRCETHLGSHDGCALHSGVQIGRTTNDKPGVELSQFRDRIRGITRPDPDIRPVDPEELLQRLMRLNDPASPWLVRDGTAERVDVVTEWKTADPVWGPVLTELGANETYATHLRFHALEHEVRSRDRQFGWSRDAFDYSSDAFDSDGFDYGRGSFDYAGGSKTWQEGQLDDQAVGTVNGQHYRLYTKDFKNVLKQTVVGAGWVYRATVMRRL